MEQYEKEIKESKLFKKAQEVTLIEDRKPITIQIITEENWVYWVTEYEVSNKGKKGEMGIYVSLNGTTLSFYDNKEDAYNNKDSEEHYYGDISKRQMSYANSPWFSDRQNIEKVVIVDEIEPVNMAWYFDDFNNLQEIENIGRINTSRVTNMEFMFAFCSKLKELDLSTFDTSKVTDMSNMFNSCSSITDIDMSGFNTSNVTNMSRMFMYCGQLNKLDVSNFNTSKVINMEDMFLRMQ